MVIRAVLFDRDGVLTYFDIAGAASFMRPLLPISIFELALRWQAWGDATGFPADLAQERRFFVEFWDQLSVEYGLSPAQRDQLHRFTYASYVAAFADVVPVLAALHARGLRIGVLSNFSLASIDDTLVAAGLAPWVDVALAATVIGAAKPAAEAYHYALAALHVEPDQCLFFDDELACVEGARAVGLTSFLVDRKRADHAIAAGVVRDLTAVTGLVTRPFNP
jgi:HAD superfamily hydrolase (TIGR01509 family)